MDKNPREKLAGDYKKLYEKFDYKCANCSEEMSAIYRSIWDAVSFFEEVKTEEFLRTCDVMEEISDCAA